MKGAVPSESGDWCTVAQANLTTLGALVVSEERKKAYLCSSLAFCVHETIGLALQH